MWQIEQHGFAGVKKRHWIRHDGQLVGAVNFGELRAYVFPLYTPFGRLVIQESPLDHPHHQGLGVGAEVNGHDMWNAGSFGKPRCKQVALEDGCRSEADADGARFFLTLDWCTEAGAPHLREERTIVFTAAPYGRIVDVRTRLMAAHGPITFGHTKEAGVSMRVPPEWVTLNGGVILDAEGRVGEEAIFDHCANWVDVSGEGPRGTFAGISLMPHTDCKQVPWMVRDYGLHVYNPWRHEEIRVAEGEALELGVRYVAHDGKGDADTINEWYEDCP